MITEIIQTLIVPVSIVILYMFQKHYLANYLNEKGKNIAQKEDLEVLTSLIEKVKNNFNRDIEHLRSDLGISSNATISLIQEEKKAIVEFYKAYFSWYVSNTTLSNKATSFDNNLVESAIADLDEKNMELSRVEAVFDLYVKIGDFKIAKTELVRNTRKAIGGDTINHLYGIMKSNIFIEYKKGIMNQAKDESLVQKIFEEIASEMEKRGDMNRDHLSKVSKINAEIYPQQLKYQENAKNYIINLAKIQNGK